ncbi:MAG: EAL domain-containing protein [Alphaproteobacteria bacterium]
MLGHEANDNAPDARRRACVLVVDDEAAMRDILAINLEDAGYDVVQRANALGLEKDISLKGVDLVLLDWMMPERSGLAALIALRKLFDSEHLPVIIVTSMGEQDIISDALAAGANDFIFKPINVPVLLARAKAQLSRRAAAFELDRIRDSLEQTVLDRTRDLTISNQALLAQIERRKEAERRSTAMALHDGLTGLPNRRQMRNALNQWLSSANPAQPFAVVAIELDRFKQINNLHGRAVGDELLIAVAGLLRKEVSSGGLAAGLGGEQFMLALPHQDEQTLIARLSTLAAAFDAPFSLLGQEITVGAILGIALGPRDGADAETLMERADAALYRTREEGLCRVAFFAAGMEERVHERAALECDLRAAIRTGAIEPFFQPLVGLNTGEVLGYEILARWRDPKRGLVKPDQFIPVAEEMALINELTLGVLKRACREALVWPGAPRLSLNISPTQLRDATLPQKLLDVLADIGFPSDRLEIEITEAALITDFDAARRILTSFKTQNVRIALDDFGTGYSSLRHLSELTFDALKIDRSFVQTMLDSQHALTLVKAIIGLAKTLGLQVTAEGVETVEQAVALKMLGCDQGPRLLFRAPSARR